MAIFHLDYQGPTHSYFKLFTISLPLFCLLISWAASTTPPTSPSSSLIAAEAIRTRGYSLFAALIDAAATDADPWNGTGTILAAPDFAFSFATAKFTSLRRAPPRPSTSLLLYHTLKQTLTWQNLTARSDGHELRTLYENRCVFVSKNFNGEPSITRTKKSVVAVTIRHPDLYVDDHLTVHGVDGVLDPTSASKCSIPEQITAEIKTEIDGSYLDHAVRALRRRGFSMVATAMAIKRSDLMNLTSLTVFAPSDVSLFSTSSGFHYDFRYHIVPNRLRFSDLARLPVGTVIETIASNKTVVIESVNGIVRVNGVTIDGSEIYQNRWIVVVSVPQTFDDAGDSEGKSQFSTDVPSTSPTYSSHSDVKSQLSQRDRVPSPAQSYYGDWRSLFPGELPGFGDAGMPSPSPSYTGLSESSVVQDHKVGDASPTPAESSASLNSSPAESPFADLNSTPMESPFADLNFSLVESPFADLNSSPAESPFYLNSSSAESPFANLKSSPVESPFADLNSPPAESPFANLKNSPTVSPICSNGAVSSISEEEEGQDLGCPVTVRTGVRNTVYVDQSSSSSDSGQLFEESIQSAPSDAHIPSGDHESGERSQILSAEMERHRRGFKSEISSDVDAHSLKSDILRDGSNRRRHYHLSVADDLFYYS